MKQKKTGWMIANENHPNNPKPSIFADTFSYTKRECIQKFISGSGSSWKYWYQKFNFRAVRAEITIEVTFNQPKQ